MITTIFVCSINAKRHRLAMIRYQEDIALGSTSSPKFVSSTMILDPHAGRAGQIGKNWEKLGQKLDVADHASIRHSHNRRHVESNGVRSRGSPDKLGKIGRNWDRNSMSPIMQVSDPLPCPSCVHLLDNSRVKRRWPNMLVEFLHKPG